MSHAAPPRKMTIKTMMKKAPMPEMCAIVADGCWSKGNVVGIVGGAMRSHRRWDEKKKKRSAWSW
jgi:hypothetical protein